MASAIWRGIGMACREIERPEGEAIPLKTLALIRAAFLGQAASSFEKKKNL